MPTLRGMWGTRARPSFPTICSVSQDIIEPIPTLRAMWGTRARRSFPTIWSMFQDCIEPMPTLPAMWGTRARRSFPTIWSMFQDCIEPMPTLQAMWGTRARQSFPTIWSVLQDCIEKACLFIRLPQLPRLRTTGCGLPVRLLRTLSRRRILTSAPPLPSRTRASSVRMGARDQRVRVLLMI